MTTSHPTPQALTRYLGGLLDAKERGGVDAHLAACVLCRAELSLLRELNLGTTQREQGFDETHTPAPKRASSDADSTEDIATGFEVGRYVVTRRLGQGAMGLVFAAYDPRLDRNVALKLLRSDVPLVENRPLRARLEREAQALAKLSHPNVVAVHDLGDYGDSLFIAMDLVEGQTLTEWLRAPHGWREVQQVFLQAGAGLAAAHRVGLVHRDFKPDNVLVGADGITRVSDFGVSRRVSDQHRRDDDDTITGAGSLIGTPNYMSPEQFDGKPADPRSDQFSFCVALFEALCGQRPFSGDTLRALADATHAGPPPRIPAPGELPRWLEALVLRGLAPKADARFPSMDELLVALAGPRRRRSLVWPAITAAAVLFTGGLLGWNEWARRRDDPCRHIGERVAGVWTERDRAQLEAQLVAAKLPWAEATSAHVAATFRAFLSRWATDYAAVCRARDEHGDDSVRSARQACLEERFASFVNLHERVASNTVTFRDGLARLGETLETRECSVHPWFLEMPEDGARRADFLRVRDAYFSLASAALLKLSGDQLAEATALRAEATALDFPQLATLLRQLEATFLIEHAQLKEAVTALEESAVMAEACHLDLMVAESRRRLVRTLAEDLDVKRARALVPSMRAAYQRAGVDPDQSIGGLEAEATVLAAESKPDEAVAKLEKVVGMLEAHANPILRADEYRILAFLQVQAGRADDALVSADKSLALLRGALGQMHPSVATGLNARAIALSKAGRNEEALAVITELLSIQERDPDSRGYTLTLYNHGLTLKRLKRAKEGIPFLERAVASAERHGEEAKLAQMKAGLAEALQEVGELDRALVIVDEALAIGRRAYGADSAQLSGPLSVKGSLLEALGRHDEAAVTLRDCLARLERPGGNAVLREVTRYELARSLWHQPATRREAVEQVEAVRTFFIGKGKHFADYVAECDEWLAAHPAR